MNRRDRRAGARTPQAARNNPGARHPAALCETGLRHLRAGQHLDAQVCCQQALAINGDHADSLHLMGLLSLHARQYDHAMEWIARAIRQDPRPEYLASLGTTLQQQGKHEEALRAFDKAVQLKPDDAELWRGLSNVLLDLQRYDHALLSLQHVLKLDPRRQDAAYKSGVLLHQFGRFEQALAHFNQCDQLLPNHAPTLQGRVRALFCLRRYQEALADARRVYKLDPANADICNYIGACLQLLGQEQEALLWFDKALEHLPNAIEILNNKAFILGQLQRFDEAFAFYDHIRTVHPNDATTQWNLALLQMLTGDFEAGWAGREARWTKAEPFPYPKFSQPMWLGEGTIDGKTILIHVDEGLGDTIQFARYVPMVAALGARVILVVERPAYPLLSGLSGVAQCLAFASGPLPAFDLHCPMGSLPLAFGTRPDTIPSAPSYLPSAPAARVQAWEQRLGSHDKLRVGLVWSGSLTHKNDVNRSTPLRQMSWLLDVDATFVSLQKDPRPQDKALLAQTEIVDLTADLTDLAETAALIGCLDLVITVDTSVAHLAGALGCPTWILLPWTPDYRWLLDRDDSPWYPSVRLFRQDETRDYASVLDRVRIELMALVAAK
jgi:tetratricopeptide (TPR) repeat protein